MNDAQLLRTSFEAVTPLAETFMETFYLLLFERYPAVQPLFAKTDMKKQQGKLLASLALVVKNCDRPEALEEPLRRMGMRHLDYGTEPDHYAAVGECLLAALAQIAGPLWNAELEGAWSRAYQRRMKCSRGFGWPPPLGRNRLASTARGGGHNGACQSLSGRTPPLPLH